MNDGNSLVYIMAALAPMIRLFISTRAIAEFWGSNGKACLLLVKFTKIITTPH